MEKMKRLKKKCDKKYHDEGISVIDDDEYDILETMIDDVLSTAKNLNKKFTIPASAGKVKLPIPMYSLNKIREYKIPKDVKTCVLMDKLDGVSCLIYENKAFTRGNGKQGTEITNILPDFLFKKIPGYCIRGELVIKKKDLKSEFSNTRSMVCSFVSRKEKSNLVDFIAYELISIEEKEDLDIQNQLNLLKKNGFKTVYSEGPFVISENLLNNFLNERLKNSEYDIDGIVVSYNERIRTAKSLKRNPNYAVAFKKNFSGVETKIKKIEWKLNKRGKYYPVAILVPIYISGSKISKVSCHNLNYMKIKGIGVDSTVEIIKSGQVIPHISKVLKKSKNLNLPLDCDEEGNLIPLDINKEDERILEMKLLSFKNILKIKGIGPSKAKEFLSKGITSFRIVEEGPNIFDKNFLENKINKKIFESLKERLSEISFPELLYALCFFGEGIGLEKIKKMENLENNINVENLKNKWEINWIHGNINEKL